LQGIREVADRLQLPLSTLHYWERRGLISSRRRGGQRCYDPGQRRRIGLIQLWQSTGLMSLDEIADMLRGRTERSDWREVAAGRIRAIDSQLDQLRSARSYLEHMLTCPRDDPAADCPELRRQIDGRLA
jgi:DNA-binding transcriptional MerR regulator